MSGEASASPPRPVSVRSLAAQWEKTGPSSPTPVIKPGKPLSRSSVVGGGKNDMSPGKAGLGAGQKAETAPAKTSSGDSPASAPGPLVEASTCLKETKLVPNSPTPALVCTTVTTSKEPVIAESASSSHEPAEQVTSTAMPVEGFTGELKDVQPAPETDKVPSQESKEVSNVEDAKSSSTSPLRAQESTKDAQGVPESTKVEDNTKEEVAPLKSPAVTINSPMKKRASALLAQLPGGELPFSPMGRSAGAMGGPRGPVGVRLVMPPGAPLKGPESTGKPRSDPPAEPKQLEHVTLSRPTVSKARRKKTVLAATVEESSDTGGSTNSSVLSKET